MLIVLVYFLCFGVFLYLLYRLGTWNHDYFEKRNLKYLKPLPFIGGNSWFFKGRLIDHVVKAYSLFPKEKLTGSFDFLSPRYFLRDIDLIKQITITDFEYFQDRTSISNGRDDDIFNKTLISMKGNQWRAMRNSLSPIFTGSKMRLMFELLAIYSKEMVQFFIKENKTSGIQSYNMKETFSKYTNDIITTCTLELQVNSFENPINEIYMIGKEFLNFQSLKTILKFFVMRMSPKLASFLKISLMSNQTYKIFHRLIIDTMKVREQKNIVRNDMIDLLMQLKRGTLKSQLSNKVDDSQLAAVNENSTSTEIKKNTWTDEELIAQCFIFFLAGFDTTSTFLSFLAYELALNPDVQMGLIEEIDSVREELADDILSYDVLQKMKYLDMVVTEGLRKWPPAIAIDRCCVKNYSFEDKDGFKIQIEKGHSVWIPIFAIHRDPQYYPDPETFNPERFSPENRKNINLATYMPFGVGPRNCIGSRFALMEVKALFYYLLSNFVFEVSEKTEIPLKLKNSIGILAPEKPIILALKCRK